jgi:hypothetical protein
MDELKVRLAHLAMLLTDVNREPLDAMSLDSADAVLAEVFDRHQEQAPVGVARFGSSI